MEVQRRICVDLRRRALYQTSAFFAMTIDLPFLYSEAEQRVCFAEPAVFLWQTCYLFNPAMRLAHNRRVLNEPGPAETSDHVLCSALVRDVDRMEGVDVTRLANPSCCASCASSAAMRRAQHVISDTVTAPSFASPCAAASEAAADLRELSRAEEAALDDSFGRRGAQALPLRLGVGRRRRADQQRRHAQPRERACSAQRDGMAYRAPLPTFRRTELAPLADATELYENVTDAAPHDYRLNQRLRTTDGR